jgi:hypothetical protein
MFYAAGCFYSRCQESPSISDGTSELIPMKGKHDADEFFFLKWCFFFSPNMTGLVLSVTK